MTLNDYSKRDLTANKNFNELLELLNEEEIFFFHHHLCELRLKIPLMVVTKKNMVKMFKDKVLIHYDYLEYDMQIIVKSITSKIEKHIEPNTNKQQLEIEFEHDPTATKAY